MKITPESMKKQYEDLWNTFCKKNHDYGSSFEQSLDKHGLIAGVVRMEDKMNRISTLVDGHKQAEVASESLADTLRDLSNYSAMAACWLDGEDVGDRTRAHWKPSPLENPIRDEDFDNVFKLASFEGHQEKVNEREYYNREDVSDEEIIKNWGLVGDSKTVSSRTTGQYLTEDDNQELFRKIFGVLRAHHGHMGYIKKIKDQLTGTDEEFEGRFNDIKELVAEQINRSREVAATYGVKEEDQPSTMELKGLENGYVIRQHKTSHNSYRYTIAFNPEGTIKVEGDVEKPYVIECFSYDNGDSNTWALHVFDTREDMVAALNYDLKINNSNESINFGDSIKGLDIKVSVFSDFTLEVLETWVDTFGVAFNNQMLSKGLRTEKSIELYQGIKTFGPVFISEKTGALVIKGTIRENSFKRPCAFIWFGDTKEVLLEVDNTIPKFNSDGIIYGVIYDDGKYVRYFNQLYQTMEDKIISKFYGWSGSDLKNLVFFNEDEALESTEDEPNKQALKQCMEKLDLKNHTVRPLSTDGVPNCSDKPLLTNPLGLENGYFIRQHTNHVDSDRYTLAFNPEGTVRVPTGEELPYVIECFGNDYDGMTGWAIHVFHSREDMVAALNYDLKVSIKNGSKRFRDSIGNLDVDLDPFDIKYAVPVGEAWSNFFGPSFVKNMTTDNVLNKAYYGVKQGVKTFGPLFISEKTGALVVKGRLRERTNGRVHNIIWFGDTKEVLLELNGMVPKFNIYGIIYGINSDNVNNGKYIEFNPLYQTMADKILYKFNSWDESNNKFILSAIEFKGAVLKNIVFFNEDEAVSCEFMDKKFQIPNDSPSANAKNTVGSDNFGALESGKLQIDFEDSETYWDKI